jgi:hypothetical protein
MKEIEPHVISAHKLLIQSAREINNASNIIAE